MRKYIISIILSVLSIALWAVPARPGSQPCTLSDGSSIQLTLMGDESYHFWQTADGRIAEEQTDGTFVITDESAPDEQTMTARRRAGRRYVNRAKQIGAGFMPSRALFILVNFSDKAFSEASAAYYKSSLGDQTEGAKSMYNYLKEQSGGQYAPPVDVFGPITLPKTVSYYGGNDHQGNDKHPAEMVVEACKALDDTIDFAQYDANDDGLVDNVYVIYAGKGEADGGAASTIWPHQWDTYSSEQLYVQLDGKYILSYACSSELSGQDIYSMGTPLHEYSHVIGLPDYYDTEYASTNYTQQRTPGAWSLMDAGSYNDNGKTPPNYSIYDKYYLGWLTPKVLAKDDQLNGILTTDYGDGYQINGGTSLLSATSTKTVYYIENRQRTGWDAALPGHGMIVWQVKYSSSAWEGNTLNNDGGSPRYTVVSASGNPRNIGKSSDPFPGTSRVTTYTPFTGCELTEIKEQAGNVTFKYNGGLAKLECTYEIVGEHCIVPADGVVATLDSLRLFITPHEGYTLDDPSCWTVEMGDNNFLTYGEGFTYDAATGAFRISKVKDEVVILAEALKVFRVSWIVNDIEFAQTSSTGRITLPEDEPAACGDGKAFVGWSSVADYASEDVAPTLVSQGEQVSEGEQFYAVFADAAGGEKGTNEYVFAGKTWTEPTNSWQSTKDAFGYNSAQGVQVISASSYSGAGAMTVGAFTNITRVVVNYCTNATKGAGDIIVVVGDDEKTQAVTPVGGTTLRPLEYTFDRAAGTIAFKVNCTTNSIFVHSVVVTATSPVLYSNYTTTCSPTSAVDDVTAGQTRAVKVVQEGRVVIVRDGKTFSLLGNAL